jgi:hypothetical protein
MLGTRARLGDRLGGCLQTVRSRAGHGAHDRHNQLRSVEINSGVAGKQYDGVGWAAKAAHSPMAAITVLKSLLRTLSRT